MPALPDEPAEHVVAHFAFDPTFAVALAARHQVRPDLRVGAQVAVPLFARPGGIRVEAVLDGVIREERLQVQPQASVWLSHAGDAAVASTGLGVELGGRAGYAVARGSVGIELRVRPTLLARSAPREVARAASPEVHGGWSALPGGRGAVGVYGVVAVGEHGTLGLSGGWASLPGGFADVGALPFQVDLCGGVRW